MEDRHTDLLLAHQGKALAFVRKTARARTSIARVSIVKCLQGAGVREGVFEQALKMIRGYAVRPLAVRIAGIGILDAAKIGEAANCLWRDAESWKDWGSFDENLTRFRRLWHVMVLYGIPNPAAHFT
jgi:hypothetical protein